ncbi:MAG: hypothetical protein V1804_03825 [Patescibacteria group bacterium]
MSTEKPKNKHFLKIKQVWLKYEQKIVLLFGLILVAAISFQFGILKGEKWQKPALIIEKPAQYANTPSSPQDSQKTQNLTLGEVSTKIGEEAPKTSTSCSFVGSKNSDKYYPPSCSYAKRIKPENKVCFGSEAEAQKKGYQRAASCFK